MLDVCKACAAARVNPAVGDCGVNPSPGSAILDYLCSANLGPSRLDRVPVPSGDRTLCISPTSANSRKYTPDRTTSLAAADPSYLKTDIYPDSNSNSPVE